MLDNELTSLIIGSSIKIHRKLGPGLLESAYKECLIYELNKKGVRVEKEKPIPIDYEEIRLDVGYRIDLLVENRIVVELKSVNKLDDIHLSQALTYLRLGNYKLGLLINFNEVMLREGIRRVVNYY